MERFVRDILAAFHSCIFKSPPQNSFCSFKIALAHEVNSSNLSYFNELCLKTSYPTNKLSGSRIHCSILPSPKDLPGGFTIKKSLSQFANMYWKSGNVRQNTEVMIETYCFSLSDLEWNPEDTVASFVIAFERLSACRQSSSSGDMFVPLLVSHEPIKRGLTKSGDEQFQ